MACPGLDKRSRDVLDTTQQDLRSSTLGRGSGSHQGAWTVGRDAACVVQHAGLRTQSQHYVLGSVLWP
jgi:hypothetical protein